MWLTCPVAPAPATARILFLRHALSLHSRAPDRRGSLLFPIALDPGLLSLTVQAVVLALLPVDLILVALAISRLCLRSLPSGSGWHKGLHSSYG